MLFLILSCVVSAGAASADTWHGLNPGPYTVGFVRRSHPSEFAVWYPAREAAGRMRLRDYYSNAAAEEFTGFLASVGIGREAIASAMDAAMSAAEGAPVKEGRFPIVALAQGNAHDAADQAVLAEYLASFGYVVVTTPSPMLRSPMTSEDQVGPFGETQARQLEAAIDAAGTVVASADRGRVAVVGHSFGTRAGLLLAMRDDRVRVMVSLDGGIGTAVGMESLRLAPSFDPRRPKIPLLHWYQRIDPRVTPDFRFLETLPLAVTTREIQDAKHVHFSTLGFLAVYVSDIGRVSGAGGTLKEGLARMARDTRVFLDEHVQAR